MALNGELFDILSWLPAKDFYRLSSVFKSSEELLSDDYFIIKQSKNMQMVQDRDFFIYPDIFQMYEIPHLESHALSSRNSSSGPPPESLDFLINQGNNIIASSNGLICCRTSRDDENPLFLFNPTTGSYLPIPLPDERLTRHQQFNVVFVCEKDDDDFLLMTLVSPDERGLEFHSRIYSPEARTWRDGGTIDLGQRGMIFKHSVKQNGVVYMVSDSFDYLAKGSRFFWPYIVAYDVKNSKSRFLEIPKRARKGVHDSKLSIFKWGDHPNTSLNSICLVKLLENVFTMWVLIRTSSSYYWKRVFKMQVKDMGLAPSYDLMVAGFEVVNGSCLIFATVEKVYSYNLKDGNYDTPAGAAEEVCGHPCGDSVRFVAFSSTLRPCGLVR
ncbi:hypothetical protein Salat_1033900 [Sesamum alatum]|uniref:F-box associated beta-propeller type 3 domain-containing protein n=1 Tax=Sesamum alatum TaxID=300844 RepID=A0AAE1YMG4_9LAMI|nr:hypothetical protein Salat_1033900 [Sesamum alatum]